VTDVDSLPPTQYLILEVLAARHRTGKTWWTFPARLKWAALALSDTGLIEVISSPVPRTFRARLTAAGRKAVMTQVWTAPDPSDLAATFRYAAQGRREYLAGIPDDMRTTMEVEVATLEAAAMVADGRLDPLYGWLPSWRWTDQMQAALDESDQPKELS